MATPTKFTPENIEGLRRALTNGAPIKHACDYVGITRQAFHQWRQRGEAYERHLAEGGKAKKAEQPFLDFVDTMRVAQGNATVTALARVREAMTGRGMRMVDGKEVTFTSDPDWRAAAWYLQHCHPDDFGRGARQGEFIPVLPAVPRELPQVDPVDRDTRTKALMAIMVDNGMLPPEVGEVIDVHSRVRPVERDGEEPGSGSGDATG